MRDLVKAYTVGWRDRRLALDRVDLSVVPGEGVIVVGPNGAGKSTLLLVLAGLRRPTAGTARVFGADPRHPLARARVGLLPDRAALHAELTAAEHLELVAAAWDLDDAELRIADTTGRLGVDLASPTPAGQMSAGAARRLALALALLPQPDLLLLDEPLAALDPGSVRVVTAALADERARGAALLVASHRLPDLAGCCDRVVRLADGAIQRLGTVESVLVKLPARVVYTLPPGAREPQVGTREPSPPGLSIRVVSAGRREALVEAVRSAGGAVLRVNPMLDMLADPSAADVEETLA